MENIGYIISLALVEIMGDFALEKYANTGDIYAGVVGCVGYMGVVYFLVKSLEGSSILYVNGMWDGFSSLFESLAAFFVLGERFSRWEQYLGLALTIVGVGLLKTKSTDVLTTPYKGFIKKQFEFFHGIHL